MGASLAPRGPGLKGFRAATPEIKKTASKPQANRKLPFKPSPPGSAILFPRHPKETDHDPQAGA
jgi:hypothetical protein